jgi:hypothetical protein
MTPPQWNETELSYLESFAQHATPEQLRQLYTGLTGRPKNPIWNPLPGKQTEAADSQADELFYGGAAGGGKTDLSIGLALTQHIRTLFLRRESTQLTPAIDRLKSVAGHLGRWRSVGNGGTFSFEGKTIKFDGCEYEDDKLKFQGHPDDLKVFDEVSHFARSQYRFIVGWNRNAEHPNQRCRVVCAGNPPTSPEGRWVVEEWAPWLDPHSPDPALPGELRWYTTIKEKTVWFRSGESFVHEGERITPRSRTFIPALLKDNPILQATGYASVIQSMPEPLRSQMLYGDMNAGVQDHEWQVIPTEWVRMAQDRWSPGPPEGFEISQVGVDCARGGADKTVISQRYGPWFAPLVKFPGTSTPDGPMAADRVGAIYHGECPLNVDVIGIGSSVYDLLKDRFGKSINPVNNSEKSDATDKSKRLRFINVRAASYWALREALDPSGDEKLELPPDPEIVADLCAARYQPLASGLKIEAKEDIVKRLGRSPDCADAIVLAYWRVKKKQLWVR